MRRSVAEGVRSRVLRTPARSRSDHGAATAETMMVLPVLVAVTIGLVWLVSLAATQARVVDAAREVARALARDEPRSAALTLGRRVAPAGSEFDIGEGTDLVSVRVTSSIDGPGGIFRFVSGVTVDAEAVSAREPG
ncbi:MAG: TadE family type IV pilus minor pilin [Nocardioides sp.]